MRVLWITYWGSWTKPLLSRLKLYCEIEAIIPSEGNHSDYALDEYDGVKLHLLKFKKSQGIRVTMNEPIFQRYNQIINKFHPDIIHVHGTETNIGQIQNFIHDIPVVVSIQGLLSGCLRYNQGLLYDKEMLPYTSIKNRLRHGGIKSIENRCTKAVKRYEQDILNNCRYFIGRTLWDRAHSTMSNPNARYYHCEELLRPEFYARQGGWSYNTCDIRTIMMPSGYAPFKGMHFAIHAVSLLKQYYPDVILKIPGLPSNMMNRKGLKRFLIGEEFLEYCKHLVKEYHLENNVVFLPQLSAEQMAEEMLSSNVFLSCSTIDNSSNAVSEATLLGVPLVVTSVGGIISFIKDEKNGLYAPSGDAYVIALQIKRLFEDKDLSVRISNEEKALSKLRLAPDMVVLQYINTYQSIINHAQNG